MPWTSVARCADIKPNDAITVTVGHREIAIFSVSGELLATAANCTHARAPLADGYLEGEVIECPLHQGRFNIRSGKVLCSPATKDLETYPVKVVEDRVLIRVS